MLKSAALLLMLALSSAATAEDIPAKLAFKVKNLSRSDRKAAQAYATCMSIPWLPVKARANIKKSWCRSAGHTPTAELGEAVRWVDHIASKFPGMEIILHIK